MWGGEGRGGKERINPQSTPPRKEERCKTWEMDRARTKTPKVHHREGGEGRVARWEG